MKHAKKPEHILKLEEGCQTALSEILSEAKLSRSQEKMRSARTLSECLLELSRIAKSNGLNLNNTREFLKAKDIMDRRNLNR